VLYSDIVGMQHPIHFKKPPAAEVSVRRAIKMREEGDARQGVIGQISISNCNAPCYIIPDYFSALPPLSA
jgi:hypothetical protein